jgi:hypothetical protein
VPAQGAVLTAEAQIVNHTQVELTIHSNCLLLGVRLSAPGYLPDDNYFHLLPSRSRTITFTAVGDQAGPFRGLIEALNLNDVQLVTAKEPAVAAAANRNFEPALT